MELRMKEYLVKLPLNHNRPQGSQIEVFGRIVYRPGNHRAPIFVYLQGGPGYPSPREISSLSWAKVALQKYRIFFLDQRGTGRSQKIGPELAEMKKSPQNLAQYLSHFRADSIVKDLEFFREKVLRVKKWGLICQSYGGFVATTYLSFFPNSLWGVIICGGFPPVTASSVDEIYQKLGENILRRNYEYYRKFPKDREKVRKIVYHLMRKKYPLSYGGLLTPRRFLDIGLLLGRTHGLERMHWFLEDPFLDSKEKKLSFAFLNKIERATHFETNPIYAILHESIYCHENSSNWAAHKLLHTDPRFSLQAKSIAFHGETIRKEHFTEYGKLKGFQKAAHILAEKKWGPLYDLDVLAVNKVPVEGIIYQQDYYVDPKFSLETVKAIGNAKAWKHAEWQHDSLRTHGKEVMEKLLLRLEKRL
ncbi:MAG: alpha/beta fold hydrolase [Planctomycetota bacterium]|nr:MAG: alpha/beta fold hydrolase [Planctomycetota bacterium]